MKIFHCVWAIPYGPLCRAFLQEREAAPRMISGMRAEPAGTGRRAVCECLRDCQAACAAAETLCAALCRPVHACAHLCMVVHARAARAHQRVPLSACGSLGTGTHRPLPVPRWRTRTSCSPWASAQQRSPAFGRPRSLVCTGGRPVKPHARFAPAPPAWQPLRRRGKADGIAEETEMANLQSAVFKEPPGPRAYSGGAAGLWPCRGNRWEACSGSAVRHGVPGAGLKTPAGLGR